MIDLKQCKNSSKNVTVSMETFSNQIMSPDFAINFDVYLVGDHDAVITLVEKSDDIVSGQHYDIGEILSYSRFLIGIYLKTLLINK